LPATILITEQIFKENTLNRKIIIDSEQIAIAQLLSHSRSAMETIGIEISNALKQEELFSQAMEIQTQCLQKAAALANETAQAVIEDAKAVIERLTTSHILPEEISSKIQTECNILAFKAIRLQVNVKELVIRFMARPAINEVFAAELRSVVHEAEEQKAILDSLQQGPLN
jgi:hypothetical protein